MKLDTETLIILTAATDLDDEELGRFVRHVHAAKWHLSDDETKRNKARELRRARRKREYEREEELRREQREALVAQLSMHQNLKQISMTVTPWEIDEFGNLSRSIYNNEPERRRKSKTASV